MIGEKHDTKARMGSKEKRNLMEDPLRIRPLHGVIIK